MAEQEEDYSSLPLTERWVHKNWKVRKEAYEAATKDFDGAMSEDNATVRVFIQDPGLWKAAVADSNVAAQQEALVSLCSFLPKAGTQGCTRTRSLTIPSIVEKGLAATRPIAKQKALEALLLYIELDKPDPVIEEMLPLLSHKLPKIIAATLAALKEIYHAYGCRTADPKPVIKLLPKMFGHADKNVRAEATNVTVECYRWLKDAIKPVIWNDLKPVQQQDLEKAFDKVKDEPAPTQERLLRSQQAAMDSAPAGGAHGGEDGAGEEAEAEEEVELDLYEPVNVMKQIPNDWQERLNSSKWKDRKECLDEIFTAINHPKIQEGQFDDILRAFAKCMKDANIAVVSLAANCIELFAKGLKKNFSKYRSTVMVPVMERLKEKKQSVTDALSAALDAVFQATSLTDCLEEILEKLKDKNPQVKLECTRFLIRCLKTTREVPTPEQVKSISEAATKLLTESQEVQRLAGAEVLGTLWKIMGDRPMGPHLEGLDEIRKTKITEFRDAAEVKAKYKPKAAPPPKAAGGGPPGRRPGPPAGLTKKPALGVKKPVSAAASAPAPLEEAPLAPRPTSRPGLAKPGVAKSGIAGPGGLRPAGGLQKKLPGPGLPSPVRKVASPVEDLAAAPLAQPKLGIGAGRGLVGRQLGKPMAAQPFEEPAQVLPGGLTGLSTAEKAELEELRAETERLRRENESLRAEKARINSQVHELTIQNAQLIEDHTRHVLTIKAKETQLVRARSAQDAAEDQVAQQQRDMDRLKRELSRQVRAPSPSPPELNERDYNGGSNGVGNAYGNGRTRSYVTSPISEAMAGKENAQPGLALRQKLSSPPLGADTNGRFGAAAQNGMGYTSTGYGVSHSPKIGAGRGNLGAAEDGLQRSSSTTSSMSGSQQLGASAAGGAESWKRAAEVTQNLKARIEMMKAKQGISRPH